MALEVQRLLKRYGDRPVVEDVSFQVDDGELVALLGPSGSGKSTILRMVAGLTDADEGRVVVDGVDVTDLPPRSRDLGFVFQNYALFEHLDVTSNVEFALRVRGVPKAQRRARAEELLDLVGLGGSARKYPSQLSGGQRQRTALARALAHKPRLLLLDEPFGALDALIRQELRQGLRRLLKQLDTTAIFVTHDQEEAFSVADRILVLHRGRLLEQGPPERLYQLPQTEFVAGFVGRANLLPGELTADGIRLRLGGSPPSQSAIPKRVKVLTRPEKVALFGKGGEHAIPADRILSRHARVEQIEFLGASERVYLSLEDEAGGLRHRVEAVRPADEALRLRLGVGDEVGVAVSQMHAVTQPALRLLVLAGADAPGRTLLEQALRFGERSHAVMTVLGPVVRDAAVTQRLDRYRQTFAGDLRLVDPMEQDMTLWHAVEQHLGGERYDLVLVAGSLRDPEHLARLLSLPGVHHVGLCSGDANPLLEANGGSWSLMLRRHAGTSADLSLLAELAALSGARVDVHDLGGRFRHADVVERSAMALIIRSVAFSVAGVPRRSDAEEAATSASQPLPGEGLLAVDLGHRSLVGDGVGEVLDGAPGRPLLLIVQPDTADLRLHAATDFIQTRGDTAAAQSLHITEEIRQ